MSQQLSTSQLVQLSTSRAEWKAHIKLKTQTLSPNSSATMSQLLGVLVILLGILSILSMLGFLCDDFHLIDQQAVSIFLKATVYNPLSSKIAEENSNHLLEFGEEISDQGSKENGTALQYDSFEECSNFTTCSVLRRPIWDPPPQGSKLPPLEALTLQMEMLKFRSKDNIIVVSFGNFAFLDFAVSWVKKLTDVGVHNILVGAMDDPTLEHLFWKGIPLFHMKSKAVLANADWGTDAWHGVGRDKTDLIEKIISFGFELLLCDSDMVWLKDPLPYFKRYPGADILTSTDMLVSTVEDESLENWNSAYKGSLNIGIVLWRPTAAVKRLLKEWQIILSQNPKMWDQAIFNALLMRAQLLPVDPTKTSSLFYAYDGQLKVGVLPISIFCSGHAYYVQELYKLYGLQPYAVHATYANSGTAGKRHRFREAMLLDDEPEYYDTPGGYMYVNSYVPNELFTEKGVRTVEAHFRLVNYQLLQIRSALAIASILNRTLVLPPIWCRNDRIYFPHPGTIPGTKVAEYFICPLDYVFEVNNMLADLDFETFGARIRFREHSFLGNPRLPAKVRTSTLRVHVCEANNSKEVCNGERVGDILRLPANLTDKQVDEKLASFRDVAVLEFSTMEDVFGGFEDMVTGKRFRKRVERFGSKWCCVAKAIGYIHYDMYWDDNTDWMPLPPLPGDDGRAPWQKNP